VYLVGCIIYGTTEYVKHASVNRHTFLGTELEVKLLWVAALQLTEIGRASCRERV